MNDMTTIPANIFRAYDIRGVVGTQLTAGTTEILGRAIGSAARDKGETTVIIGRDGRHSGAELAQALAKGLQASGCDVMDIGRVPTPLLYFATHTLKTRSGVMITGSHNPPEYNGFKIVIAGETLACTDITALYDRIRQQRFQLGAGQYKTYTSIVREYLRTVDENIFLARALKIVIDAGNGIAGAVAPQLFRKLGCEVIELFCDVDGTFPNHHPDPSDSHNLKTLIDTVKQESADIGLAFDGDGDRLGVVIPNGEVIGADRQMILFAKDILQRNPGADIIFDVKCSKHLGDAIRRHGGNPVMWKTGHSLIKAKLRETQAPLAGEMSGHIFFKERWFGFDDALYAGARLLEILAHDERDTNQVFAEIPNSFHTPEIKLSVPEEQKFQLVQQFVQQAQFPDAEHITTLDGLRADFKDGWGLVRASNTTPCLILRFEADTFEALARIRRSFSEQLQKTSKALCLSIHDI